MFYLLKRKIECFIILSVLFAFAVLCFIEYSIASKVVHDDFYVKTKNFSGQIAKNISIQMNSLNYATGYFIKETGIEKSVLKGKYNVKFNRQLEKITKYAPAINGAIVFGDDFYYSTRSEYKDIFHSRIKKVESIRQTQWYCVKLDKSEFTSYKREILFLIIPIFDIDNTWRGAVVADINKKTFIDKRSIDNAFLKDAALFMSVNGQDIQIAGDAQDADRINTKAWKRDGQLYNIRMNNKSERLLIYVNCNEERKQLAIMQTATFLGTLPIVILCILYTHRMTDKLMKMLIALKNKMDNFILYKS